jgi:multidrug resistance efflux pump
MNSDWKKKIPDWIPADRSLVGVLITLLFVVVAIYLGYVLWMLYMRSPWTRDAFVRAEVADIATEGVSGYVTAIYVKDNQKVQAGDPLFDIDPTRYQFAVKEAEAQFETAKKKLVLQTSLARMRVNAQGAVSVQDKQIYDTEAAVAQDAVDNAKAALDLAKYNLYRTRVLAPCDGYMTNMRLRLGDYAQSGQSQMQIVDNTTFWIEGYFEEIKLINVKVGAKATIKLIAYPQILQGEVKSIGRGVLNQNNTPGYQGLQNVNPIDAWIRLAQRIPVHIAITDVPEGVFLAAGLTASVDAGPEAQRLLEPRSLLDWIQRWLEFNI